MGGPLPPTTREAPPATSAPARATSRAGWRHAVRTTALGFAKWVPVVAASVVMWVVARARRPRRPALRSTQQQWYKEKGDDGTMGLTVRQETGSAESEDSLRIVLQEEGAEALRALMQRSQTHNPEKTARLEKAAALAACLKSTGRLPA
jgi:hypothetical protein